jgi:hypothetical protein
MHRKELLPLLSPPPNHLHETLERAAAGDEHMHKNIRRLSARKLAHSITSNVAPQLLSSTPTAPTLSLRTPPPPPTAPDTPWQTVRGLFGWSHRSRAISPLSPSRFLLSPSRFLLSPSLGPSGKAAPSATRRSHRHNCLRGQGRRSRAH